MNFVQATTTCMRKYSTFSGRAKRSEFWWFYLFATLVSVGFELVVVPSTGLLYHTSLSPDTIIITHIVVSWLPFLVLITPALAAGSRRLHDIGISSWWLLLWLTGIGGIVLIVWWVFDTKPEGDKYGEAVAETA